MIKGQTILITGASSGIGLSSAKRLAMEGANLVLLARRIDRLNKLKNDLQAQFNEIDIKTFEVDLSHRENYKNFFKSQSHLLDRVDTVICNAGIGVDWNFIEDMESESIDQIIEVNLNAHLKLLQTLIPGMRKRNRGDIVFIGSVNGRWGSKKSSVYCATKFALNGVVESIRLDLMGTPIRVQLIQPGLTETEFSDPEIYKGFRPLQSEDIADSIFWILSRPKHINIQEMVVYSTDQAGIHNTHRTFN